MCHRTSGVSAFWDLHCTDCCTKSAENIVGHSVSDVIQTGRFDLCVSVSCCGLGMAHASTNSPDFYACGMRHSCVGMTKLAGVEVGDTDGFLEVRPEFLV